jgi:hypothetical protein
MALLQWKVTLDCPWQDRLVVGKYFLLIPGTGAVSRRRVRSSGG